MSYVRQAKYGGDLAKSVAEFSSLSKKRLRGEMALLWNGGNNKSCCHFVGSGLFGKGGGEKGPRCASFIGE